MNISDPKWKLWGTLEDILDNSEWHMPRTSDMYEVNFLLYFCFSLITFIYLRLNMQIIFFLIVYRRYLSGYYFIQSYQVCLHFHIQFHISPHTTSHCTQGEITTQNWNYKVVSTSSHLPGNIRIPLQNETSYLEVELVEISS